MINFCLANKYADVLLNMYKKNDCILEECQQFIKILEEKCLLNDFFINKNVTKEEKIRVILSLKELTFSNIFFELLVNNNRAEYIKYVLQLFFHKYEEIKKIGRVRLLTCNNVNTEYRNRIEQFIMKKFNLSQVIIENIIDKTLVGGFIVVFKNIKYDCSLKNNLQHIAEIFN